MKLRLKKSVLVILLVCMLSLSSCGHEDRTTTYVAKDCATVEGLENLLCHVSNFYIAFANAADPSDDGFGTIHMLLGLLVFSAVYLGLGTFLHNAEFIRFLISVIIAIISTIFIPPSMIANIYTTYTAVAVFFIYVLPLGALLAWLHNLKEEWGDHGWVHALAAVGYLLLLFLFFSASAFLEDKTQLNVTFSGGLFLVHLFLVGGAIIHGLKAAGSFMEMVRDEKHVLNRWRHMGGSGDDDRLETDEELEDDARRQTSGQRGPGLFTRLRDSMTSRGPEPTVENAGKVADEGRVKRAIGRLGTVSDRAKRFFYNEERRQEKLLENVDRQLYNFVGVLAKRIESHNQQLQIVRGKLEAPTPPGTSDRYFIDMSGDERTLVSQVFDTLNSMKKVENYTAALERLGKAQGKIIGEILKAEGESDEGNSRKFAVAKARIDGQVEQLDAVSKHIRSSAMAIHNKYHDDIENMLTSKEARPREVAPEQGEEGWKWGRVKRSTPALVAPGEQKIIAHDVQIMSRAIGEMDSLLREMGEVVQIEKVILSVVQNLHTHRGYRELSPDTGYTNPA